MSIDIKLGNDYLRVPRLPADGKGFVVWKEHLELSIRARGLYGHLDGTVAKPNDPPTRPDNSVLTQEEVSMSKNYAKKLATYIQEEAIVFQQIASTIPDSLYLKIKGKLTVKEAWDALKADFEKWSRMITIELCRRLHEIRCAETGNICTHFDNIQTMREELASLGTALSEPDFSAVILGSLPKSYDQFISAVIATASVLKRDLDPEDLMQTIIDEYDRQSTRSGIPKEKGLDAAFFARGANNRGGKAGKRMNRDVKCFNCHKKGHKKMDCWVKGGGKEGQGPRSKERKEKGGELKKEVQEAANTAGDEDGIWMAIASNSDDEKMADNEFDDFEVSDDDLFISEEGEEVTDLTVHLKRILNIPNSPQYMPHLDDNPKDFLNKHYSTNSSDDEQGAVAMQVSSESDSEVEINPYWSKVRIDELQGLGNPMETSISDKIIPDSESTSESEISEDLVNFLLTPPNSLCLTDSEKGSFGDISMTLSDEEMIDLIIDEGEDGLTTFDAAMLVNVGGSVEGIQTELYDSGASCHMSPYRDHFEDYVPIAPKSITTADKRYFQAIGKGNLRIKIPNGTSVTTVLLKDVLHCPDMGLTLVSVGKITAAGYQVIFRGMTCKIHDSNNKVIGQIIAKNGLYRVDHEVAVNIAMAGEAREVLTLEELHRRMGHIALETVKRMVRNGVIEGLEADLTVMIQPCASCEYGKATRKPIKKTREQPRALKFGDEIHSDVWGPSPVQTPGHKEYYVSFTDDHTRWTHLTLLATKNEVFEAYKTFEAWAKLHFDIQAFKILRSDRGGEYLGTTFSSYLASKGTLRKLTVHDTPEYNGVSERLNQTLLE